MPSTVDRWQAQYNFWSSFGVPAYEQNSVPDLDDVVFPFITYEASESRFNGDVLTTASIYTRSTSWAKADELADAVFDRLKDGGATVSFTGGLIWITAEPTFAKSMGDPDDDRIKRKLLTVVLHFC